VAGPAAQPDASWIGTLTARQARTRSAGPCPHAVRSQDRSLNAGAPRTLVTPLIPDQPEECVP
jgi:hypothetical protein